MQNSWEKSIKIKQRILLMSALFKLLAFAPLFNAQKSIS